MKKKELEAKEKNLAEQLKFLYCDSSGNEINPKESAKLLWEMGKNYQQRCPDKVCLIQSAALLKAAIERNPDNVEDMRRDLKELCSLVVMQAEGDREKDLIKISETIKQKITKMRKKTDEVIKELKKIPDDAKDNELHELEKEKIKKIGKIQRMIAKKYKAIINCISKECESILGKPPCKYALLGMGSLAREEITPYSDFESCIVLGKNINEHSDTKVKNLEYFRWYSVIFQIIVINFGETILPRVCIPSLNNPNQSKKSWFKDHITVRGISFDGFMAHACKNPLGRQQHTPAKPFKTELIKSVKQMVNYIDMKEDTKNGYHLADMLMKPCFISGNEKVFDEFKQSVEKKIAKNKSRPHKHFRQLVKQLLKDRNKFDLNKNLFDIHLNPTFNMKRVVYRTTTVFLSTLARLHDIEEASCLQIIAKLAEKNVITPEIEHKLKYAIAVACEIRLKIYMKKRKQDDWLNHRTLHGKETSEMVDAVGEKSIVDYFAIAWLFQSSLTVFNGKCSIDREVMSNIQTHFKYSVWGSFLLHLHKRCIRLCQSALAESNKDLRKEYRRTDFKSDSNEYSEDVYYDNDDDDNDYDIMEPINSEKGLEAMYLVIFGLCLFHTSHKDFETATKSFIEQIQKQIIATDPSSIYYINECLSKFHYCCCFVDDIQQILLHQDVEEYTTEYIQNLHIFSNKVYLKKDFYYLTSAISQAQHKCKGVQLRLKNKNSRNIEDLRSMCKNIKAPEAFRLFDTLIRSAESTPNEVAGAFQDNKAVSIRLEDATQLGQKANIPRQDGGSVDQGNSEERNLLEGQYLKRGLDDQAGTSKEESPAKQPKLLVKHSI